MVDPELTEAEQRDSDEINASLRRAIRVRKIISEVLPVNEEHEAIVDALVNKRIGGLAVKRMVK